MHRGKKTKHQTIDNIIHRLLYEDVFSFSILFFKMSIMNNFMLPKFGVIDEKISFLKVVYFFII